MSRRPPPPAPTDERPSGAGTPGAFVTMLVSVTGEELRVVSYDDDTRTGYEVWLGRTLVETFPDWEMAARYVMNSALAELNQPAAPPRCGDCGGNLYRKDDGRRVGCDRCGEA